MFLNFTGMAGQTTPYQAENTKIFNPSDSIWLSGTLILPQGNGPFPGVVLVAGSGEMDRDQTYRGHKTFRVLSDYLARRGIASLRYDKRGVGQSQGDFEQATLLDFASDAVAALSYLKSLDKINLTGFIGHSEGGKVAPMAALNTGLCDFLVLMAAQGLPTDQTLLRQTEIQMRARGKSEMEIEYQLEIESQIWNALKVAGNQKEAEETIKDILVAYIQKHYRLKHLAGENLQKGISEELAWFSQYLLFDEFKNHLSSDFLSDLKCPVLAVTGTKDLNVTFPEEILQVASLLMANGNLESTIKVYPGLNHMFQKCETGLPEEIGTITETLDPQVLSDISTWILSRDAGNWK